MRLFGHPADQKLRQYKVDSNLKLSNARCDQMWTDLLFNFRYNDQKHRSNIQALVICNTRGPSLKLLSCVHHTNADFYNYFLSLMYNISMNNSQMLAVRTSVLVSRKSRVSAFLVINFRRPHFIKTPPVQLGMSH